MTRLERNMNWLATTATASPFIGLLGTVLGIIQAFLDLSKQQSTSLKTVGPGIATALIATAVGLLAAIPAAIFYNLLGTKIRDIGTRMDDFALEFLNMWSAGSESRGMGMSVDGGGYRSRRRGNGAALSEINVTPFVDVVLVLLIIFMLTAHVMDYGMEVDVPKTTYVKETTMDLPIITIDKTGDFTLNGAHVNIHELVSVVHSKFPGAKGVYVRADAQTIWDPIAQVTAELGNGKLQVYLVTQPDDGTGRRKRAR